MFFDFIRRHESSLVRSAIDSRLEGTDRQIFVYATLYLVW